MRASHDKNEVDEWVSNLGRTGRSKQTPPRHMNKINIVSALGYAAVVALSISCVKYIAGA